MNVIMRLIIYRTLHLTDKLHVLWFVDAFHSPQYCTWHYMVVGIGGGWGGGMIWVREGGWEGVGGGERSIWLHNSDIVHGQLSTCTHVHTYPHNMRGQYSVHVHVHDHVCHVWGLYRPSRLVHSIVPTYWYHHVWHFMDHIITIQYIVSDSSYYIASYSPSWSPWPVDPHSIFNTAQESFVKIVTKLTWGQS